MLSIRLTSVLRTNRTAVPSTGYEPSPPAPTYPSQGGFRGKRSVDYVRNVDADKNGRRNRKDGDKNGKDHGKNR